MSATTLLRTEMRKLVEEVAAEEKDPARRNTLRTRLAQMEMAICNRVEQAVKEAHKTLNINDENMFEKEQDDTIDMELQRHVLDLHARADELATRVIHLRRHVPALTAEKLEEIHNIEQAVIHDEWTKVIDPLVLSSTKGFDSDGGGGDEGKYWDKMTTNVQKLQTKVNELTRKLAPAFDRVETTLVAMKRASEKGILGDVGDEGTVMSSSSLSGRRQTQDEIQQGGEGTAKRIADRLKEGELKRLKSEE